MLLADTAIERLVLGVRVDVDQAGNDQPRAAVDNPVGRAGVAFAEKADTVVGKSEIDITPIGVAALRLVPADDPGSVFYHRSRHGLTSGNLPRDCFAAPIMTMSGS